MNLLAVVGASVMAWCTGLGAIRLIAPCGDRGISLAFPWLLGTGIISLLIWIFGFISAGIMLPTLVTLCCLSILFAGWRVSRVRAIPARKTNPFSKADIFFATILLIQIVVMFYWSYVHTLGLDGILNWEIKARYAYANAGVLPASYLQDSGRAFTHPGYPLGIPNTEMWFYFWLGDANQFWIKTIFALFYTAGVLVLVTIGAKLSGRNIAGFVAAVLLFFVPQMSVDGGSALVGYADFPLSIFYLASIGSLLVACRREDQLWFGIYAACLAFLPWIKVEGIVLWLTAAICGAIVIVRQKKSFWHLLALLPGAVIFVSWRCYVAWMQTVSSHDFLAINLSSLASNIHRLGPIGARLVSELTNVEIWSVFWPMAVIAALFFACANRNLISLILFVAMVAPTFVYAFSYVFSPWPDYLAHMNVSISRLLMHVAPLGLLIAGIVATEQLQFGTSRVPN